MFYIFLLVVFFLLIFMMQKRVWTKWGILFGVIILVTSGMYVQTYAVVWNVAFGILFLVAIFLLRMYGKEMRMRNLFLIFGLAFFYAMLDMVFAVYHEFLRVDLWIIRGLCLLILLWIFERNTLYAACFSVIGVFLGEIILGVVQQTEANIFYVGRLSHLNELGFVLLGFIFFTICEMIQTVEKNYG